jgi:hypothetical protein
VAMSAHAVASLLAWQHDEREAFTGEHRLPRMQVYTAMATLAEQLQERTALGDRVCILGAYSLSYCACCGMQ